MIYDFIIVISGYTVKTSVFCDDSLSQRAICDKAINKAIYQLTSAPTNSDDITYDGDEPLTPNMVEDIIYIDTDNDRLYDIASYDLLMN